MATSLVSTGVTFPDGTTQTTAAAASSYAGQASQFFTSSGTFTVPTGVTSVQVTLVAGGGGGGGSDSPGPVGGRGGAGGSTMGFVDGLTPGGTVSVTVGAGGNGANSYNGNGGTGGTSSFGTYISATGGNGGINGYSGGGVGNSGSGGGGNSSKKLAIANIYTAYGNSGAIQNGPYNGYPGGTGIVVVQW